MKRFLHKIQFLFAGLYISFVMGIPLRDAMQSAKEAEEIIHDLESK